MTKHEFMERLTNTLKRNGIEDISEIIDEYEQHFAFKMADGFCEAEIAAKLAAMYPKRRQPGNAPLR